MTGSLKTDRENDRRLVDALRGGEANAVAEVFDTYGAPLYDYCHSLLCDQSSAGGVVLDSLVSAQENSARLREPERFRGWLYAIARKECLRRLAQPDRKVTDDAEPAFGVTDGDAVERERIESDQQLVISALAALSVRQREVIELAIRHHLDVAELAGVLLLPLPRATDLLTLSLGDLDAAFAAATGATHRQREIPIAQLLRSLPAARIPVGLRRDLLTLGADQDKHQERTRLAQRAGPFDIWGWPTGRSEESRKTSTGMWSTAPRSWAAVAAVVVVLLIVGAVFLLTPGSRSTPAHRGRPPVAAGIPDPTPSSTPRTRPKPTPARTSSRPLPPPARIPPKPSRKAAPVHRPVPPPGKAVFSTSCDGSSDSCAAALSASRGTVHWSASPSRYVSVGESRGTLSDGETVIISISADTQAACTAAEPVTTGTVSFSPGGPAFLSWSC